MVAGNGLAKRVEDLNRQIDVLQRENQSLRKDRAKLAGKKDIAPKKALTLDRLSAKRIGTDTGLPIGLAQSIQFVFFLILSDVGASHLMGLSIKGFWFDPTVAGGIVSGLAIFLAAGHKFVQKFD